MYLLFYSFMPGGSTYYSLTSTHYSLLPPIILGFSNLIKDERSVRMTSNELNDALRVFETIQTETRMLYMHDCV